MILCPSCGGSNSDGTRFCVRCGAGLAPVPEPGSWRAETEGRQATDHAAYPTGDYTPPAAPPAYQQPPAPLSYQQSYQSQQPTAGQQMHPVIPALISFFFPGLGLLAVPNKAGLGIGIFAAYLALGIVGGILTLVVVGLCVLMLMPLANIAAAIHSWDEAAKQSNGQFQPLLFK